MCEDELGAGIDRRPEQLEVRGYARCDLVDLGLTGHL